MSTGQNFGQQLNRMGYGHTQQPQSSTPFSMHMPGTIASMGLGAQQHQQYPGINSIPGMHAMSSMNQLNSIQNIHGLQGMPTMQQFSSIPGISAMQSLLHPSTAEAVSNGSLSASHSSNTYGNCGLLSGAVEKRRKYRPRQRNLSSSYGSILGGEEAHPMMMVGHQAAQAASHPEVMNGLGHSLAMYQADGIQFKTLEQLPDTKIQRLRSEKIKPIESLTFSDIKAYNRNQLRAYCSVYGIRRKKKAEMERDMARYAALFHPNDAAYDISKFVPTEYADGPIPRRKVPVTKEQKERAAGDVKRLTNALQQRPQSSRQTSSSIIQDDYAGNGSGHDHVLQAMHNLPQASSALVADGRLHDIHGTHHATSHSGHQHHHHHGNMHGMQGHGESEPEGVVGAVDLMNVPEMVPNHLLSISHQIGEE